MACLQKERDYTALDIHCSERESQAHLDNQDGKYDRSLQSEISGQCTARCKGYGGSQQVIQGAKHARLFSNVAERPQCNDD